MIVLWNEVPCNGKNGPITGYYLTYTNITSNTSYTVNITGGTNRLYTLTGLLPYTNYTSAKTFWEKMRGYTQKIGVLFATHCSVLF